jgi:hypothetical protein
MNGVRSAGFQCFEPEKCESTFLANAPQYPMCVILLEGSYASPAWLSDNSSINTR